MALCSSQEKILFQGYNMPEETQQLRQVAYKIPIVALLKNPFVQQSGWLPSYVLINGKQISRINIIATIIDMHTTEALSTITLDDSTGIIQAKAFNEDLRKVTSLQVGDSILLIGKPRKYNEQLFLTIEIIKKIDPLWTKIRKKELQSEFEFEEAPPQPPQQDPSILIKFGEKLLTLIKELDSGDGADINLIISKSGIKESEVQQAINELIKLGEIYEPKANKVKLLE